MTDALERSPLRGGYSHQASDNLNDDVELTKFSTGSERGNARVRTFNVRGGTVLTSGARDGRRWSTRLKNPMRPFYALLVTLLLITLFCIWMAMKEHTHAGIMKEPTARGEPLMGAQNRNYRHKGV